MHDELLEKHLSLVIEANKTTNITRISSWEDGMLLHVKDSLLGLDALNACPAGRYADIGTGAGYPGIPLAIESGRETLLVDSVAKKVHDCLAPNWARTLTPLPHRGLVASAPGSSRLSLRALFSKISILLELASCFNVAEG